MRQLLIIARIWIVRLAFRARSFFPVREQVVLATAHIGFITGNLAAIGSEIERRDPTIRIIRLVHNARPGWRGRFRAFRDAFVAGYYLASARLFIVDSHYTPLYVIRPRPGTTIVQTWHACAAIKKIGYSVLDKPFGTDERTARLVRIHSNYDLVLAASRAAALQYVEAFRQPLELFVTRLGIPRTDVLFDRQRAPHVVAEIRRRYGIPEGRRVVLYAPTFRGVSLLQARSPEGLDFDLLASTLGDDHVLLVRLHPAIRAPRIVGSTATPFLIDVSDYPEVNELLLVADVLVTDYSSLIFEFALLGRPMAYFAPDVQAYEDERGFYFDYRANMPGPVFETTESLAAYLRAGDFDIDAVRRFAAEWFDVFDGRASERFMDEVVVPALAGRKVTAAEFAAPEPHLG